MWPTSRFRFAALASAATATLLLHGATTNTATATEVDAATTADQSTPEAPRVNGWYPCAFSTEMDPTYANATLFECAELEVPLCYDGVCESDRQIDLFVKRRLAITPPHDANAPPKALIHIQGGPGASAAAMESKMIGVLDESVDYYTFDHRGVGRSEFLECDAAQALTGGSPDGKTVSLKELQACIQDLNFKYDGQAAAFSTTSAAMDVRSMIDAFLAKHHVYVAGYSYGSFLTQRILQLQLPQVHGYIFDGVDVLTPKGDKLESANSHWNQAIQPVGKRLLEYCFDDAKCPIKFKSRETVLEEMLALIDGLDKQAETNDCAKLIAQASGYAMPSVGLRVWLNTKAKDTAQRVQALQILGHVQHCTPEDVAALLTLAGGAQGEPTEETAGSGSGVTETEATENEASETEIEATETETDTGVKKHAKHKKHHSTKVSKHKAKKHVRRTQEDAPAGAAVVDTINDSSELLYNVIVFSERMSEPAPTKKERDGFFFGGIAGNDDASSALSYCVFTGSTDPACQELSKELPVAAPHQGPNNVATTFSYQHDKYFDMPLELPAHVSALIINGGLDFQTPSEFGHLLYDKLTSGGSGKGVMMVDFDYGNHCSGESVAESTDGMPCHDAILAAFIKHDGDVNAVDTNCMEKLPSTSFA